MGHGLFFAGEDGHAEGGDSHESHSRGNHVIGAGGGIGLLGRFLLFGGADDDDGAGVIGGGIATRLGSATIDTSTGMIEFVVLLFNYCSTTSIAGYLVGSITIIRISVITSMVARGRFVISTICANIATFRVDMGGCAGLDLVTAAIDRALFLVLFTIDSYIFQCPMC